MANRERRVSKNILRPREGLPQYVTYEEYLALVRFFGSSALRSDKEVIVYDDATIEALMVQNRRTPRQNADSEQEPSTDDTT